MYKFPNTETITKSAPMPIPGKGVKADSIASSPLRSGSMLTLEESDLELPNPPFNGHGPIPRSYSPANSVNSRSSDARKRYSYYDNVSSLTLGSPSNGTPLLESLLDSNVGVDLPQPRSRGHNRSNSTNKFSSSNGDPLLSGASGSPLMSTLLPPPTIIGPTGNELDQDFSSLPPPPTPPFITLSSPSRNNNRGLSGGASNHSAHSSISSTASFQSTNAPPSNTPSRSASPALNGLAPGSPSKYQPFNFQSVTLKEGSTTPRPNQRRGHKYKHSSVSMNFFKEDVRAPLAIPASLPIPNISECKQSMSKEQKVRITWGACHLFVAFLVYTVDSPFTALSALAHLLFYDAMGALMCAVVDIIGNFDVWKRSSIHLPFGLERAEVLAGFALSISLIFMGGDIMSHCIQDIVRTFYVHDSLAPHNHGSSHHHHGDDSTLHWSNIILRVCLAIIVTVVSAVGLDNHTRISHALRNSREAGHSAFSSLPWILSNPSHFITVTFSAVILILPFVTEGTRRTIDTILTPCIAGSMCYMGWMLAKSLGGMLVMSFPGENRIDQVEMEVKKLPSVISVSDISVWQVHHSAWLACMKIVMIGTEATEQNIREQASKIIKDIMGENIEIKDEKISRSKMKLYQDNIRWETTIDIHRVQAHTHM